MQVVSEAVVVVAAAAAVVTESLPFGKKAGVEPACESACPRRSRRARQYAKDYVFYPALAGPFAPKVVGNALANGLRNVWAYAVIQCGHLTEETRTFVEEDLKGETRGGYYLRQILGSSNIEGGPLLGVFTGHLSHQIEHHLFPDIPARRYREMSTEVRRICDKHHVPYNTGSFGKQFKSVLRALLRYSVPNAPSDEGRRGAQVFHLQRENAAFRAVAV